MARMTTAALITKVLQGAPVSVPGSQCLAPSAERNVPGH